MCLVILLLCLLLLLLLLLLILLLPLLLLALPLLLLLLGLRLLLGPLTEPVPKIGSVWGHVSDPYARSNLMTTESQSSRKTPSQKNIPWTSWIGPLITQEADCQRSHISLSAGMGSVNISYKIVWDGQAFIYIYIHICSKQKARRSRDHSKQCKPSCRCTTPHQPTPAIC